MGKLEKAIIGGTGVYGIEGDNYCKVVETIYGQVEVAIVKAANEEIVFLGRHGKNHSAPPHLINYRANMQALRQLGVKYVYAIAAVGSCNENYAPGAVVVLQDFLDMTKHRVLTFYEGGESGVKHADMSEPYCCNLRKRFYEIAGNYKIDIQGEAVYVCTEGPRFETRTEIKSYKTIGGEVVGMTSVPEVVLAKELGMCYASIGIVTNWCTGMQEGEISLHDIRGALANKKEQITQAFLRIFADGLNQNSCSCCNSLIEL